jgi:uncharacterized membrane protein
MPTSFTPLGIIHTAISIIALLTGVIALIRDRKISWDNTVGKIYVVTTILTCVTGFGIFQHGGFGKAHVLGVITLLVLVIAFVSGSKTRLFGRWSPYIETVSYSLTFFFHLIPTITETTTRLPVSAPLESDPNAPAIQTAIGICFLLFLLGATLQVLKLRRSKDKPIAVAVAI